VGSFNGTCTELRAASWPLMNPNDPETMLEAIAITAIVALACVGILKAIMETIHAKRMNNPAQNGFGKSFIGPFSARAGVAPAWFGSTL
jgi:hypothetical protein